MSLQGIFDPMVRAYFENEYGGYGGGEADHSMEDGLITGAITEYRNDRVESVADYTFHYDQFLERITLPNVKTVGAYACYNAAKLKIVDLHNVTSVGHDAFKACPAFEYLVIRNETMVVNVIPGIQQHTLLVPRALVSEYKATKEDDMGVILATFDVYALEDYTVDGTVTGELDLTKMGL